MPIDTSASSVPVEKFVALATKELASSQNIEVDQVALITAISITWPDAALGCPEPGKVYAQGRVPGYQITLEANGTEYVYHTDQTGKVILCPDVNPDQINQPSPGKPVPTPTIHIGVPIK